VRTLTGHRSGCLSIAFHPFGDFVVTGSLDTNLKVWDLRRKECIQTYKGHAKGITHVSVSPDGRWVVSGCEAGEVKVGCAAGCQGPAGGVQRAARGAQGPASSGAQANEQHLSS
jgi:WD40 repeat protein